MKILPDPPKNGAIEAYLKQENNNDISKLLEPQHDMNIYIIDTEEETSEILKQFM